MAADRVEVAILGAGISGCALAYHLVQAHVGPVAVFDPSTPAAGASGRAAGIVTEQLWNEFDVAVARDTKEEYARLAARYAPDAYSVNGFARWSRNPEAVPVLAAANARLRAWGVPVRSLDASELSRRLPEGRFEDVRAALISEDDGVVTPSAMTEIYAARAREQGAQFWLGTAVEAGRPENGRWGISLPGRTLRASRLVVAAGAWSKRILRQLGHPVPLCPYRTQAAILRPEPPTDGLFPSVHDIDQDVYVRPEANGRILAGDGTEHVEADPDSFVTSGDASFVEHLAACFGERFPGWASADLVRAWAGVCTSTPDRRPLIGPVPGTEGLYVDAGFNGFGVMRASGVARRLAALLAVGDGSTRELDELRSVLPGRFHSRSTDFAPRPGFTLEAGDEPRF
jgi:sarcosine oxidase, subunit beta